MDTLKRLLKFVKPYQWQALGAFGLLIVVVVADLAQPRLVQRLVDQGVAEGNMRLILFTALIMMGLAILNAVMMIANTVLAARVSQYFAADLRSALFRKIQTFSFGNLDELQTGELMVRLTSDVTMMQSMLLLSLRLMTRAPLMMVGSAILMVVTSPRLAVITFALLPLIVAVIWFFVKRAQPLFLRVQQKLDRLNQVLQENMAGMRVVKAFVRADYENQRFATANDDLMQQTIHVRRLLSIMAPTMFLLLNFGIVAVVWFGGRQVIAGELSVGQIMAFNNYLLSTMFPMLMLSMMVSRLPQARASAQRITEVLDHAPEVQDRTGAQPIAKARGRVMFEKVSFSYNHGTTEAVLTDINLVAEPGQTVAILGTTGSGKSSLIHLVPRFYDVAQGRVTLDGVDIRDLTQASLRAQMGVALQEAVLFSGTVRDNIRYGRPEATEGEVIAAARAAQAHDFIVRLPGGYDARVEQRGANLSGGQKQRIAIARALLVRPQILILDDSTSAVDVETEAKLQEALESLIKARTIGERGADAMTTFVVAQRISTVLTADKIVVLDRGKIVAEGTHRELLQRSPIYQEIYDSQLGNGTNASAVKGAASQDMSRPKAATERSMI